jgi:tight adherence protein C
MTKRLWIVPLFIILAMIVSPLAVLAAGDVSAQISSLNADSFPRVSMEVAVASAEGNPLQGLKAKDFQVTEDGHPMGNVDAYPIYQSAKPLSTLLLMDTSGSMEGDPLAKAQEAAKGLANGMRPIDRMAVVGFANEVGKFDGFSGDRKALAQKVDNLKAAGGTTLYDALLQSAAWLRSVDGSRAIVVLSDGGDNMSQASLQQAVDAVVQEGIPVYTIGLGDGTMFDVLQKISDATGGRAYRAPSPADLAQIFRQISNQLQNRYVVSYDSKSTEAAGTELQVRVIIQAPSGAVEASSAYTVPVTGPGNNAGDPKLVQVQPPAANPLPQWWPIAAGSASAVGTGVFFLGLVLAGTNSATQKRMRRYVSPFIIPGVEPDLPNPVGQIFSPLVNAMGGLVERVAPSNYLEKTADNLVKAGSPAGWGVRQFLAFRLGSSLVLGGGFWLLAGRNVLYGLLALVLGFLLPGIWLGLKISSRRNQILRSLPDALDLLTISVEAGLSFSGAMLEVCNRWNSPLTREFAIALSEMKMGKSRRESLEAMAKRVDIQEMGIFVGSLVQADQVGMSIAATLAVQADQMRLRRRQRAEEAAHKAAIKMLFPLVFLIFPALFVVILGPAIPQLGALFGP